MALNGLMSDLWQDRDFNFGVSEEEEIEIPIRNRRFSRSVYCKESGEYVGEVGPFIPLFCVIVGFLFFGLGIFGFLTPTMGEQTESVVIGLCFGGVCNLMGYLGLYPYFSGIAYPNSRSGGEGSEPGDPLGGGDLPGGF